MLQSDEKEKNEKTTTVRRKKMAFVRMPFWIHGMMRSPVVPPPPPPPLTVIVRSPPYCWTRGRKQHRVSARGEKRADGLRAHAAREVGRRGGPLRPGADRDVR